MLLVNTDCQILISGSHDGTIMIHPLRHSGSPTVINLNLIHPQNEIKSIHHFPVNADVLVLTCANLKSYIYRYTTNGRLIMERCFSFQVYQLELSHDGKFITLSTPQGILVLSSSE